MKWDDVPNIQSLEELVTSKQLAELLGPGVFPSTIQKWRMYEELPYVRLGRIVYFSKTQVVHWMNGYQRTVVDKVGLLGRTLADRARTVRLEKRKKT